MKTQLFIIGGNEKKSQNPNLLKQFIKFCGNNPKIVIITGASSVPIVMSEIYTEIFLKLGARTVNTILFNNRKDGENLTNLQYVDEADGIFITGGNQVKLAINILGTSIHHKLIDRYKAGMIYGGTSAGASIVSSLMVAGGRGAYNPRKNIIKLSGGLGLMDSIIIDQHFRERNRFFRLSTAISINPNKIGVGVDENTAIYIINEEKGYVFGANTVTIIDGREIDYSGHEDGQGKEPIALTNIKFHTLPPNWGYCFKLFKPFKMNENDFKEIENKEGDFHVIYEN
jgi:cyanophycinase